jgi:maltooligosyltrehalose trehalohydrolase
VRGGHRFDTWAPLAERVAVRVGGRDVPAEQRARGWWAAEAEAAPGDDYWVVVDGDALPDPRSPWQPEGVDGPSRLVDHDAFAWTDAGWSAPPLSSAVVYELHVGTFSPEGTFDGVAARLDHLVELGVTTVELCPVAEFPGRRGWGYDGVDLWAPHHAYGGPEGMKRLVDACHRRGLAVVLDVVYNHFGPYGNHTGRFGPYVTDRYSTPWGGAVNFDGADSEPVRRFFVENALMWLRDYHVDGLRLDAVHAIVDMSATHVLEELADEVRALEARAGRHLFLIAESDLNDPRLVRAPEAGGYGLDAQWSDDFHHALHVALTGEQDGYYADFAGLGDVATALARAFVYAGDYSEHRRRRHGRAPTGLSGHRFLAYAQNHDQVGNRARGERISQLAGHRLAQVAAAVVLTSPFVPMLFQGEEWAAPAPFQYFTDHPDPDLADAVRRGRQEEFAAFGWAPDDVPDPQDPATFERSRLDWDEVGRSPHREVLDWYRTLVHLRRSQPALADGRLDRVGVAVDERERWLRVERGPVTVVANLAGEHRRVPVAEGRPLAVLAASDPGARVGEGGVEMPPESAVVLGPGQ